MKEKTGKPYIIIATSASGDFANSARGYYSLALRPERQHLPERLRESRLQDARHRSPRSAPMRGWPRPTLLTKGLDGGGAHRRLPQRQRRHLPDRHLAHRRLPGGRRRSPDRRCPRATPRGSSPTCSRRSRVWTDNHSWVLPKGGTNAETRKAALVFLKFLWDHNFDWARGGGHLPARQSLMAEYAKLPLRQYVVDIPSFGRRAAARGAPPVRLPEHDRRGDRQHHQHRQDRRAGRRRRAGAQRAPCCAAADHHRIRAGATDLARLLPEEPTCAPRASCWTVTSPSDEPIRACSAPSSNTSAAASMAASSSRAIPTADAKGFRQDVMALVRELGAHDHALSRRQLRLRLQLGGRRRPGRASARPASTTPGSPPSRTPSAPTSSSTGAGWPASSRCWPSTSARAVRRTPGISSNTATIPAAPHYVRPAPQARLGAAARREVLVPGQRDGRALADLRATPPTNMAASPQEAAKIMKLGRRLHRAGRLRILGPQDGDVRRLGRHACWSTASITSSGSACTPT